MEKKEIAHQPVLLVEGDGIAEAWEKSVIELWNKGTSIKTQYDKETDPLSRDATMIIVVKNPFSEPRIHLSFPGGFEDLEKYKQEVVDGIHDGWINPEEGKWTYTYHERFFSYQGIDQIDLMIKELEKAIFTRRAQAITWIPAIDPGTADPPCLQRIWCRVFQENEKNGLYLSMNTNWRSRDAYRAAFMNMFGLTELQRKIADELSIRTGLEIKIGQYADISDSYHIYGSTFQDFEERFLKQIEKRDFYNENRAKSRTIRSDSQLAIESFEYGKELLKKEKETGIKGAR